MTAATEEKTASPRARLNADIRNGVPAGEAVEKLLLELPPEWRSWVRPFIMREATHLESRSDNRKLKQEYFPQDGASEGKAQGGKADRAAEALKELEYHTPEGKRVLWSSLTLGQIRRKMALMRKQVDSAMIHISILEAAEKVIVKAGGNDTTQLGEVDNWDERLRQALAVGRE